MSQSPFDPYDPNAFDLYIFNHDGEAIHWHPQFSNTKKKYFPKKTASLSIGKWYAAMLASCISSNILSNLPFSVSGRTIKNGKIDEGKWLALEYQRAYVFFIKATGGEDVTISDFDLVFGDKHKSIHEIRYHIPKISLQTNSDKKTYFSFHPSYKDFKVPTQEVSL